MVFLILESPIYDYTATKPQPSPELSLTQVVLAAVRQNGMALRYAVSLAALGVGTWWFAEKGGHHHMPQHITILMIW